MVSEQGRSAEIMDAVERLLARGGVSAVSMRAVAAEAGVSLRLVQYYGSTKDDLLAATLERHAEVSAQRWQARVQRGSVDTPVDVVAEFLREALPLDREGRDFHRVGVAMEALAMASPEIAGRAYRKHLGGVADGLGALLASDALPEHRARRLALEAMSLAHGVGTMLMVGQISAADANVLVREYLERLVD